MTRRLPISAAPVVVRPFSLPERPERPERGRALTAGEWTDAALWSMREGVDGVAVESVARSLGVTKGSFYWHFKDRGALVTAALERWEELATRAVIEELKGVADPRDRLRRLFASSILSEESYLAIEMAIAAAADDAIVAPIVGRVSRQRLSFIVGAYREMGFESAPAQTRAILAYSAFLGVLHVLRNTPEALPSRAAKKAYVQHIVETLVPPLREAQPPTKKRTLAESSRR